MLRKWYWNISTNNTLVNIMCKPSNLFPKSRVVFPFTRCGFNTKLWENYVKIALAYFSVIPCHPKVHFLLLLLREITFVHRRCNIHLGNGPTGDVHIRILNLLAALPGSACSSSFLAEAGSEFSSENWAILLNRI